jgi:hypothetical protein
MDISNNLTEDELFEILKNQPDFDCLPLPARWFKKYNIPPREATDFSSFVNSRYTTRCGFAPKDLPAIVLKEPYKDASGNIRLVTPAPLENIPIEIVSKPYDIKDDEKQSVEQFLKDN